MAIVAGGYHYRTAVLIGKDVVQVRRYAFEPMLDSCMAASNSSAAGNGSELCSRALERRNQHGSRVVTGSDKTDGPVADRSHTPGIQGNCPGSYF